MAAQALNGDEIQDKLASLNASLDESWEIEDDKLTKTFVFADFVQAFGFMTKAAIHAEKADHHPEWFNVYKKVKVQLTTHEAGGISDKDFELAATMEKIAQ